MNREFMEGYYDLKYPDTYMRIAIEQDECCKSLYDEIMMTEGQVEAVMREKGEEALQIHRKLFVLKGELEAVAMRLAYLQGAEDREKMLE